MKTEIYPDYSAFFNRSDKSLNGVSPKFAEANPDYEKRNATNKACWNCFPLFRLFRLFEYLAPQLPRKFSAY